jgi:hypothetical protein
VLLENDGVGGSQDAPQHHCDQDGIVQLPEDGDDIRNEVDWRRKVEKHQHQQRPVPPRNAPVARQTPEQHRALRHEGRDSSRHPHPPAQEQPPAQQEKRHDECRDRPSWHVRTVSPPVSFCAGPGGGAGRRGGLKIPFPSGSAGSSPAPGIRMVETNLVRYRRRGFCSVGTIWGHLHPIREAYSPPR